jgi:hypothetical protein
MNYTSSWPSSLLSLNHRYLNRRQAQRLYSFPFELFRSVSTSTAVQLRQNYKKSGPSFVFRRSRFQISTRIPAILTDVFSGFPESLQANAGVVPLLGYDRFLPNSFQFVIHLLHFHSTL